MNEFGRKQLEKYGWTTGKGLGKEENGIIKPIKPKLKFDTHGIGHDSSKIWTSRWWCDAFNEASERINVIKNETGVSFANGNVQLKPKPLLSLSTAFGMHEKFVKAETMNESKELPILLDNMDEIASISQARHDDHLYRKCEGIKKKCYNYSLMKGKLKRVKKQEADHDLKSEKHTKSFKKKKHSFKKKNKRKYISIYE